MSQRGAKHDGRSDAAELDTRARCECCRIADRLDGEQKLYALGSAWLVNAREGHSRPGVVVQTREHRAGLTELTPHERTEMGAALTAASGALASEAGVEQVYVNLWNEGEPAHVHFHVVPRMSDDEAKGPELRDLETVTAAALDAERVAKVASQQYAESNPADPSKLVRGVRRVCSWWHKYPSPYSLVFRRLFSRSEPARVATLAKLRKPVKPARPARGAKRTKASSRETRPRLDPAEIMVMTFLGLGVVTAMVGALTPPTAWFGWLVGIALSYRVIDMALWEIGFLLKIERSPIRSIPRALVLKIGNLVELAIGLTALRAAFTGDGLLNSIRYGADVVLPQAQSAVDTGDSAAWGGDVWLGILGIVGAGVALLIISGGVATLVAKVSETFYVSPRDSSTG